MGMATISEHVDVCPRVNVPLISKYDLLVGGACRDWFFDYYHTPKPYHYDRTTDYDLWFINNDKYIDAIRMLVTYGFKLDKTTAGYEFGQECVYSRWSGKNRGQRLTFDIMLFSFKTIDELKDLVRNRFEFRCNACWQEDGILPIEGVKGFADDIMEMKLRLNSEVSLTELYYRIKKFKKMGWEYDTSIVDYFLKRSEKILEEPKEYPIEDRYVKHKCDGYSSWYVIRKNLLSDFVDLLDDDTKVLAFMSSNKKILKAVQKAHNKHIRKMWLRGIIKKICFWSKD